MEEVQMCTQCKVSKAYSEYSDRPDTPNGKRKNCKECVETKRLNRPDRVAKKAASDKKWYKENRDAKIARSTKYQLDFPEKAAAISNKRRSAKLQRTPNWIGEEEFEIMGWAYETARERTLQYGVKFEVDHVVPLQGKYVSGFHCPENLQVITATENRIKSNNFSTGDKL